MADALTPLDDVLGAIEGSNGNVSLIAKKLGCTRQTVYNHMKRWKSVEDAIRDERRKVADAIESTLLREALGIPDPKSPGAYLRPPNITALIFVAKAHPEMRARGWREGADVRVRLDNVDFSKLSDDELEAIARGEG